MRRVASPRYVFTKDKMCFDVLLYCHFSTCVRTKKMRIENSLNIIKKSARELRSETISCNIWIMSVPKQPPLELKSASCKDPTRGGRNRRRLFSNIVNRRAQRRLRRPRLIRVGQERHQWGNMELIY